MIGPSGSGKSTLINYARTKLPHLVSPVSCTTRTPRPGETDGTVYYFVNRNEFHTKVENDEFLEWAEYSGNLYGTLKSEILPAMHEGKHVLREVEVQGARLIKDRLPAEQLGIIFVDGGSWEELERRILSRAAIQEEELAQRRARSLDEISFRDHADIVVKNEDGGIDQAKEDMVRAIKKLTS